jgi:RNA polymerase sigma factor (TIGR02999 family)
MPGPEQITQLLAEARQGNIEAKQELLPLVHAELHRLAVHYMRGEKPGHTLQPTALVNEAYLRLFGGPGAGWESRAHFFGTAARLMRNILVDHARGHQAGKRGGSSARKVSLESAFVYASDDAWQMVALDDALERLEKHDSRQCQVVECRFFAGLDIEETAVALGISPTTVKREWTMARAWLHRQLSGVAESP